ncbi:MAG: phosphate transport system regulatory protein PhoU, partial [Actinomycetota bacterium]|nr:phosphate transport system regulatory protein PhoU [Actinomycetota bacterium]
MRKVFQEELTQVGEQLVEISKLVSEAMGKAATSFQVADVDLAEDVIAADARIDFLQTSLDERAIDILALQGPVASDLRMIVGALRMSASLERMGDLARHIAQLARLRFPSTVIPASM